MKKKSSTPRLPPLSLEALHRVELLEQYARHAAEEASNPVGMTSNTESLTRSLRTCAVQLLAVQFEFYDSLPNFQHEWELQIAESTLSSLLGLFPLFVPSAPYRPELTRTINDYLKDRFREAEIAAQPPKKISRQELRDSYFARFPEAKVLDVCWASAQHYCEWKRWLRNAVKDGSAPDRAFGALLTSGKRPQEYRKERRKKGWK
jgi:hypothetical protein